MWILYLIGSLFVISLVVIHLFKKDCVVEEDNHYADVTYYKDINV